jgi:hypothetical protein
MFGHSAPSNPATLIRRTHRPSATPVPCSSSQSPVPASLPRANGITAARRAGGCVAGGDRRAPRWSLCGFVRTLQDMAMVRVMATVTCDTPNDHSPGRHCDSLPWAFCRTVQEGAVRRRESKRIDASIELHCQSGPWHCMRAVQGNDPSPCRGSRGPRESPDDWTRRAGGDWLLPSPAC